MDLRTHSAPWCTLTGEYSSNSRQELSGTLWPVRCESILPQSISSQVLIIIWGQGLPRDGVSAAKSNLCETYIFKIPNGTVDVAMTATNNTTPISIWNDFNSTYSTLGKRAPITLYLPGCTSVLSRNSQNPTALKKSGPFHFSPQGGLYLTNRLENAQAMIRLDPTKCSSVNIDGRISKFMIATYEFDDAGLRIMDLDNWHWYQHHHNIQPSLPVWVRHILHPIYNRLLIFTFENSIAMSMEQWDNQSLHIIPYKGPNSQNAEIYQRYLSSHIVIGTLAPATHYGPGLTDLFTLWVFKTAYDPDHTGELRMVNPIDREYYNLDVPKLTLH
ncbi:hypothetical protein GG344DRAFT_82140 [Lentinula edodes]|nr:hypothetical protein GG344DRAFT_82140 [Lentinula edodes]